MRTIFVSVLFSSLCIAYPANAQTGSINEPIRYIGTVSIDPNVHEGRLRYAIGTESRTTTQIHGAMERFRSMLYRRNNCTSLLLHGV